LTNTRRARLFTPRKRPSLLLSGTKERPITVTFNHTIIAAKNRDESAKFFRELLEVPEACSWGVFTNIQLDEGVLLQFAEPPVKEIQMQHYAFLLDDDLFDRRTRASKSGALSTGPIPG
jgi:hypothetical protein